MTVAVNHDYPSEGALRLRHNNGDPVRGGTIKIYKHTEFNANMGLAAPVAETVSDVNGDWEDTIELEDGQTWSIRMHANKYGPKIYEVVT